MKAETTLSVRQRVRAITQREKIRALSRALQAQPPGKIADLLYWFHEELLKGDFHPTVQSVSVKCYGAPKETPLSRQQKEKVKNLFTATRNWLRRIRPMLESEGVVYIDIPPAPPRGPLASEYTMQFFRAHQGQDASPSFQKSIALGFWHRMVHALKIHEILLVYDTPKLSLRGQRYDNNNLWAGSGEVAAACLIGESLSQLQPRIRLKVRRWCDIAQSELEDQERCMVILGSALKDAKLNYLRSRDRWSKLQRFHFTPSSTKGDRSFIHRGQKPKGPLLPHGPYQYREKSSAGEDTDFALVSFFRDDFHQQTLIGIQAITTVGTLGAARYMFDEKGVDDLLAKMAKKTGPALKKLPSFELILSVPVDKEHRFPGVAQFRKIELYSTS